MSLTNPNTVVTEQRLNDFYKGILPYLGGMPEMVANKFSKGDLYSTDEKMIGQWTDGKPLYQKTIDFGKGPNNAEKSVPHGIGNLDKTVNISGVYVEGQYSDPLPNAPIDSTGKIYSTNVYIDGTNLHVRSTYDFSKRDFYITLQYTKTTDSAISIGNDTDYSTEEKIIGTWIDGKPLYQKTVQIPSSAISSHSFTDSDLTNADTKLIVSGYYYTTDLVMPLNQCEVAENTTHYTRAGFRKSDNSLYLYVVGYNNVQGAVATLQYTKTT